MESSSQTRPCQAVNLDESNALVSLPCANCGAPLSMPARWLGRVHTCAELEVQRRIEALNDAGYALLPKDAWKISEELESSESWTIA